MDRINAATLPSDDALPSLTTRSTGRSPVRALLIVTKVTVTLVAAFLVSRAADWTSLLTQVRRIDPILFGAAILICMLQIFVAAYRWQFLTRALDPEGTRGLSFWPYLRSFYIAQVCGQIAPFVAGDAVRVFHLHDVGVRMRVAFKSVLIDRAIALVVLFALALPFVLFSPVMHASNRFYGPILSVVMAGLVGTAVVFAIAGPLARLGAHWRIAGVITEALLDLRRLAVGSLVSLQVICLYLAVHACAIFAFWTLARGQGLSLDLIDAAAIVPMTILVTTIPVAIAGWGLREGFLVALLLAAGLDAEGALLLSLSFGSVLLLAALPGALIWLTTGRPAVQNPTSSDREIC
jgi:hypothetical protein